MSVRIVRTPGGCMQFGKTPMSNAERQRDFRRNHPGYYQRLHAKRRAAVRALGAQIEFAKVFATQILGVPVHRALPAPVETIVIPGLNATGAKREAIPERVAA